MVPTKPVPELPRVPVPHHKLEPHLRPAVHPDRAQAVVGQAVAGHHQADPDHDRFAVCQVTVLAKLGCFNKAIEISFLPRTGIQQIL